MKTIQFCTEIKAEIYGIIEIDDDGNRCAIPRNIVNWCGNKSSEAPGRIDIMDKEFLANVEKQALKEYAKEEADAAEIAEDSRAEDVQAWSDVCPVLYGDK